MKNKILTINYDTILIQIFKLLDQHKIECKLKSHIDYIDNLDGKIQLGGKYKEMHIQVGESYYQIWKHTKDNAYYHIEGSGNLIKDIEKCFAK
jgi:hypothetical protein